MKLWYQSPAQKWEEALPAGNGTLGCMLYGGTAQEHLQLNEDSLWSGGPADRINPDCAAALPEIRQLLRDGRIPEAEELALAAMSGTPYSQRAYQTLGDLYIEYAGICETENYCRSLELETGALTVDFSADETMYSRKVYASYPDQVIVIELHAEGKNRMNLLLRMDRSRALDHSGRVEQNTIYYTGQTGRDGIAFCCMLRCINTDGNMRADGDILRIKNASSVTLCLSAGTSFRYENPFAYCNLTLDKLNSVKNEVLFARHCADFTPYMQSTTLKLENTADDLPTDKRLAAYAAGTEDAGLESLYFAYGRYLLLSSSRSGSLPTNLQGIWNKEYYPPWDSKYTININTEMNYWPAESCGLGDCHLPLFDHIARMKKTGSVTAQRMYGCRGFTAHHNTDIWADTAPQDQYIPATYWPMGAAWLCTHIWHHYRYTLDKNFLAEQFDTLEQAVLFFIDYLERDAQGYFVTNPSVSPENTYILPDGTSGCMCVGSTMDEQILRELFTNYLDSAKILSINNEITSQAEQILSALRPTQIGSDGRLLEWAAEYGEAEPGHRHISHLYGLAPGSEIHPDSTPELAEGARKTLEYRLSFGGGHTGWSRAWITLLWARLREGNIAHDNLRALLSNSTFPNLMDNHPLLGGYVFQIDGNFGATAAIVEFLVQSGVDFVRLLPALPESWACGEVKGIRLPGNAQISLKWKDHMLTEIEVTAASEWKNTILYKETAYPLTLGAGETKKLNF